MRILLIHRYFWPDTPPYATILLEVAKALELAGHDVSVFSCVPSYKQNQDSTAASSIDSINNYGNIKVIRLKVLPEFGRFGSVFRLINYLYFPLRVFLYISTHRRIDIVMCSTIPTVLMGFFTALGAKLSKSKFIYHCMDLHPEIGRMSGEFKNPRLYRLLLAMETWTCKKADAVIVLSKDMESSVRKRYSDSKIQVIRNFAIPDSDAKTEKPFDESKLKRPGVFRLIFAGNIGRFQSLDVFPDAMALLTQFKEIELVFLGAGKAKKSLEDRTRALGLDNIKFYNHVDIKSARRLMQDADLGLVSLSENIYKYAYPSKMVTLLELGCPILVNVESKSSLAKTVERNKIGYCIAERTPASVAQMILVAYEDRSNRSVMASRCIEFVRATENQEFIQQQWSALFRTHAGDKHAS